MQTLSREILGKVWKQLQGGGDDDGNHDPLAKKIAAVINKYDGDVDGLYLALDRAIARGILDYFTGRKSI